MSLLYRALKKAEDKVKRPDPEPGPDIAPQPPVEEAGDKPRRNRLSRNGLLGLLVLLSVASVGGALYLPEIGDLLVPRAMPPPAPPVASAPAGPTAEEQAAEARRLAEEQRLAEAARLAEETRIAEEARLAEEARIAEEARLAEETRLAEEAEFAEEIRAAAERRIVEEQRRLDEFEATARAELALITRAVEEARREREALGIAQRLAHEQAAANAAEARNIEEQARETLTALRDEIAKRQAALSQMPSTPTAASASAAASGPEAVPQATPEPTAATATPVISPGGTVDVGALVTLQAGEPVPVAPAGPINIEREGSRAQGVLAGLITVIDESDYFRDRYNVAERSLNGGQARSALAIYDELLGRQPRDRVALLGRATALHQLNKTGDAIRAYETVLRIHPDELSALTNLLGLIGQQSPKIALQQLGRLYASHPSFGSVAAQMAMLYVRIGDNANAIRLMSEAAALTSDNPVYQINLAIMHDRAGDNEAAMNAYERALLIASGGAAGLPLSSDAIRERLRYLRAN